MAKRTFLTDEDEKRFVKSVNGQTPDENGNVEIEIPDSDGNVDLDDIINGFLEKFPVVGVVDSDNNITIYGALESGDYFLRYENEDGSTTDIGSFTVVNTEPDKPDVPVEPDEPEKTLISISATYSGGPVAAGTAVNNLTGIVVTAHYSDGTSETVTGYTLSGAIAEGDNTITVTYGGMIATFTVTGKTTVETIDNLAPAFTEWTQSTNPDAIYTLGNNSFTVAWAAALSDVQGALNSAITGLEIGRTVAINVDIASSTGTVEGIGFNVGPVENVFTYGSYCNKYTEIKTTSSEMYFQFKVSKSKYSGGYPVTINVSNFAVYYVD